VAQWAPTSGVWRPTSLIRITSIARSEGGASSPRDRDEDDRQRRRHDRDDGGGEAKGLRVRRAAGAPLISGDRAWRASDRRHAARDRTVGRPRRSPGGVTERRPPRRRERQPATSAMA
jgi:hypothetical protein